MTAKLCGKIDANYSWASDPDKFFSDNPSDRLIKKFEEREKSILQIGGCKKNLFFGFFFDGTKNNYVLSQATKTQSNIARLYDCYPGESVKGVLPEDENWKKKIEKFGHFFKVYVPGVATPFSQVGDSGTGWDEQRGAAMGYKGEVRIAWALLQAINNVHRFFLKTPLLAPDETLSILRRINLEKSYLLKMSPTDSSNRDPLAEDRKRTRLEFQNILQRLHKAISPHWPDKTTGRPKKIDPGSVQKIYISIFGFSRGATQARAFTNWLMSVCRLDASMCQQTGAMTLGGFKVEFDFLGLFDTVASVGFGNTLGNSTVGRLFDGHGAWADAENSLRIPENIKCVHLVAAHELRRSFPLESISVKGVLPARCEETVFPGVHSDLGCGYAPGEQGRGLDPDGADMLARIPLLVMYKAARLSGVPLKLELADDNAKKRFMVAPSTIAAFNGYIAACKTTEGTLTEIMREQAQYQMQWRLTRRIYSQTPLEKTASFKRASNFDQNDLHGANREFELEIDAFNKWLPIGGKLSSTSDLDPGFKNEHENEWRKIARWWHAVPRLKPAMTRFFEDYVHDSRAWFKLIPGHRDNEEKLIKDLEAWEEKRKATEDQNAKRAKEVSSARSWLPVQSRVMQRNPYVPLKDGLTDDQRNAAVEYARTKKIPRMATAGREPFEATKETVWIEIKAGYLRFRKIYGGWDSVLLSQVETKEPDDTGVA